MEPLSTGGCHRTPSSFFFLAPGHALGGSGCAGSQARVSKLTACVYSPRQRVSNAGAAGGGVLLAAAAADVLLELADAVVVLAAAAAAFAMVAGAAGRAANTRSR